MLKARALDFSRSTCFMLYKQEVEYPMSLEVTMLTELFDLN